jgi:nitroimidazol reductase NimA-like FMN-containing flavoprotein (pyridoxamine 5'-phosphate oxidase superfamily)
MVAADDDPVVFEALDVTQCLRLAGTQSIGRLAVGAGDGPPFVVPVNFVLDGDVVMFRTAVGSKLRLIRGAQVTFEVDGVDADEREGWSVIFQGPAYEASHWEYDGKSLEPWAPGEKEHWVRVVPTAITGRRIVRTGGLVLDLRQGHDVVRPLHAEVTAGLAPWRGAPPASSTRRPPT